MFPSRTASPRPEERRLARPAAGGKKVGAGRLGPLARRGRRSALGAVASEAARGTGLVLPLAALQVLIEKKKKKFFFFFFS